MDYPELVAQSLEELRLKTAAHDQGWHLGEADWSVDQDVGEIAFETPRGIIATCSVQIIGTFNTVDSTWLWGWDHPSVQPPLREHAERLRNYGQTHGVSELMTPKLSCTEEQCWEFTALACKLNDAQGGYRGPSGSALVFMTFGVPRLSSSPDEQDPSSTETVEEPDEGVGAFMTEIPDDVRATVVGFIQALYDWEIESSRAAEKVKTGKTKEARRTFKELVERWFVAGFVHQAISFGTDPRHSLKRERLISVAKTEDEYRVRTESQETYGTVSRYEYHLRREEKGLRIVQVYLLEDGDKFKTL